MNRWKLISVQRLTGDEYKSEYCGYYRCTALVRYGVLNCYGWRMTINDKSVVDQKTILTVSFTVQADLYDINHHVVGDYELNEDQKFVKLDYVDDWFVCTVPDYILSEVKEHIKPDEFKAA